MKFLNAVALFAGIALCAPNANAQAYIYNLGSFDVGRSITANLSFTTGDEFYVGVITVASDMSAEAGTELVFSCDIGSPSQDSEIAIYGENGLGLVAMNDDGDIGSWGDPSWGSRLAFGETEIGDGSGYNGDTNQGTFLENPSDLMAGNYAFIVCTYSTTWDEENARATDPSWSASPGNYTVSLSAQ